MHLDLVEAALEDFLASPHPGVIGLTGKWGRGKTYFWRNFLESRAVRDDRLYSYVSLFGIADLHGLRDAIFESAGPLSAVHRSTPTATDRLGIARSAVASQVKRLRSAARRYSPLIDGIPKLGELGPLLRSIAFLSVSDYVVCLDDVERHSDGLQLRDILGLAAFLRDQRKCRVLFILNSDAFSEDDRNEFEMFREKVFDYELQFEPDAAECARIVFANSPQPYQDAASRAVELRIQNIRVLLRVRRIIDSAVPHLVGCEPSIQAQVIHSAVLLGWSYNTKDGSAPPYDYVRRLNYASFMEFPPGKVLSAEQKDWNALLSSYDYHNTDELDEVICSMLESGYLNESKLQEVISERNQQVGRAKVEQQFHDAWQIYHGGFGHDEEQLVAALSTAFRDAAHLISFVNASATTTLLRDLGRSDLADELASLWIERQAALQPERLNLSRDYTIDEISDKAFYDAVTQTYIASPKTLPPLEEVLARLTKQNRWGDEDLEVLSTASEDDYYNLFASMTGSDTRAKVRAALRFQEFGDGDAKYAEIAAKTRSALLRLAGESPLNRRRVAGFGIDVP